MFELLSADSILVEPTSGNQGIGVALVGAVLGYQVKIIMPDSVSEERRKLVSQYGAQVILIHDEGDIGKCIEECMQTALRMAEEDPRVFIPQQFTNPRAKGYVRVFDYRDVFDVQRHQHRSIPYRL